MGQRPGATGPITVFLASKLRAEKDQQGLSLYKMADLTGIPRKSISNYLTGERAFPVEEYVRICVGLDLDPRALLGDAHQHYLATEAQGQTQTSASGPQTQSQTQTGQAQRQSQR